MTDADGSVPQHRTPATPERSEAEVSDDATAEPGRMRVSDQERDHTVSVLNEHSAAGRLTLDELEQRVEAAFHAKTSTDLDVLTSDLPAKPEEEKSRRKPRRWLLALLGGSTVRGRFRAAERVTSVSFMGGDTVDLRDAEVDGDELVINAFSLMGGTDFYVPDSVDLIVEGFCLMGGNDERGSVRRPRPGAPVIRIRSYALMGGSEIWRLPAEARGMRMKEARKVAKAAERGK